MRPALCLMFVAGLARGATGQARADTATATLSDSGIVVRFPRSMSPDSITRDMPVMDLFSGYEWRVALLGRDQALLAALVVPPDDSLVLHRYTAIKAVYMAGDLRQCQRDGMVLACGRAARGLVRDVDGRIEIDIVDSRWLVMALETARPVVRLVVKRNRVVLWTRDLPLIMH
ncbi:MAG: hypothetical protein ACREL5_06655 [Gemmatimonadales bacterium]